MKRMLLVIAMCLIASTVSAATVELTFGWNKNVEADLAGYRVYMSSTAGSYVKGTTSPNFLVGVPVTLPSVHPNEVIKQITGTDNQKIYFVLTAFDKAGNESAYSNEISYTFPADTTPPAPPSGFLARLQKLIQAFLDYFKSRV
jgi:endoglucanase